MFLSRPHVIKKKLDALLRAFLIPENMSPMSKDKNLVFFKFIIFLIFDELKKLVKTIFKKIFIFENEFINFMWFFHVNHRIICEKSFFFTNK